MTDCVLESLRDRHKEGPCQVLDLDGVRDIYAAVSPIKHESIENEYWRITIRVRVTGVFHWNVR
jgi:hypothetical protein